MHSSHGSSGSETPRCSTATTPLERDGVPFVRPALHNHGAVAALRAGCANTRPPTTDAGEAMNSPLPVGLLSTRSERIP